MPFLQDGIIKSLSSDTESIYTTAVIFQYLQDTNYNESTIGITIGKYFYVVNITISITNFLLLILHVNFRILNIMSNGSVDISGDAFKHIIGECVCAGNDIVYYLF